MTSYVPSSWSITIGARDAGPCLICTLHESPPVLLTTPSLVTDWMKKRLNSPKGAKDQGKRQSDITVMGLYAVLGISRPRNYKKRSELQNSAQVPVEDVSPNPTPGFKASMFSKRVKSNTVRLMSKNRFKEAMTIGGREIILSPWPKFTPIPYFVTLPVFIGLSYSRTNIFSRIWRYKTAIPSKQTRDTLGERGAVECGCESYSESRITRLLYPVSHW